jgi:hypothetical protein
LAQWVVEFDTLQTSRFSGMMRYEDVACSGAVAFRIERKSGTDKTKQRASRAKGRGSS